MDAGGRRGRRSTAASLEAGLGPGLSRPLDRQLAGPLGAVLGPCFLAWARLGLLGPESVDLALGQGTTLVVVTPSCPHVAPAHTRERVVAEGTAKPPDGGLTPPPALWLHFLAARPLFLPPGPLLSQARAERFTKNLGPGRGSTPALSPHLPSGLCPPGPLPSAGSRLATPRPPHACPEPIPLPTQGYSPARPPAPLPSCGPLSKPTES